MSHIEAMTDYLATVKTLIDEHGWTVQTVGADEQMGVRSYSVGLTTFRHPEIIMLGFEPKLMTRLINEVGNTIKAGRRFADWSVVRGIVTHYPVVFREVQCQSARQNTAVVKRFFAHYRLLHLFMPDMNGLFPWQDDCTPAYKRQLVFDYVSTADGIAIL